MRSHTTQAHYQLPTALVGKYVLAVDMTARILATGSAHAHWSAQCPELVVGLNASIQLVAPDSGRKLAVMMDEEAEICTFRHPLITALRPDKNGSIATCICLRVCVPVLGRSASAT